MNDLIGFFDSGVGGISVLKTACRILPNEHFLFYGDNLHAPYGTRPLEEIRALTAEGVQVLLDRGVKALVIACNTATSAYAATLRSQVRIPVVGMEPAIKPAQQARSGGAVLAFATRATLGLPKFARLMAHYGDGVIPVVGEGLVELVESGRMDTAEADETVAGLIEPYVHLPVDAIVLGCTHYPFLLRSFRKAMPDVPVFDGRTGTVLRLKSLLEARGLCTRDAHGSVELSSSGGPESVALMRTLLDLPDIPTEV